MPGAQMGMLNLNDMFGKALGGRTKSRRMTVLDSHPILVAEESDKLLDDARELAAAMVALRPDVLAAA